MAEHGVELMQGIDLRLYLRQRDAELPGHLLLLGGLMRQELMQRRIEQADRHGQAVHGLEDALEVLALNRLELGQGLATSGFVVGEDHLAHRIDPVALKEHVLGAAQADAFGAEFPGHHRVVRRVGVGAHLELALAVGPFHQIAEVLRQSRLLGRHLSEHDFARRTVDRDPVTLLHRLAAGGEQVLGIVDAQRATAGHAALAHASGHHGGM